MSDKIQTEDIKQCKKVCKMRGWQFITSRPLNKDEYRVLIKNRDNNFVNFIYNSFHGTFENSTIPTDKKSAMKYFEEAP